MRHLLTTLSLIWMMLSPALAQRPFDANAANGLQRLVEPEISPDGRWVVYGLRVADVGKDKYLTDLWLAPSAGAGPRRLSFGGDIAGKPHWQGADAITFLAARGSDEEQKKGPQLWRLPLAGATVCLLYTSPSPRDLCTSRMPSSA